MTLGSDDRGSGEVKRHQRFTEPAKFLPVAFVSCNIFGLWLIYCLFHLKPMLQLGVPPELQDQRMRRRAIIECICFQIATSMLVFCYIKSILVSPGEIPDKEEDPYWEYQPQDGRGGLGGEAHASLNLQESKRSGERRYCKWCAKYKPDRCHHCRVCRTCILKMDHHCPWIYNCVGFKNHKFFFLLLLYSVLACHCIMWTMIETVMRSVDNATPFLTMFLLLFGETLASFLGVLVTAFFGFHIWLTMRAMTTIEFCEKSLKKTGYDSSSYDQGPMGNIKAVLGPDWWLWILPIRPPSGTGLNFVGEHSKLTTKRLDANRGGLRLKGHQRTNRQPKSHRDTRAGGYDEGGGRVPPI